MKRHFVFNSLFLRMQYRLGIFWPMAVSLVSFILVFLFGLYIYMGVEGWSFQDSFYQIIITLSTVGYQEANPLSPTGRMLTCVLILMGVGGFFYFAGSFTQILIEGRLQMLLGRRRVQKIINGLRDHYIVCGYGRIGGVVTRELLKADLPLVVVERDPEALDELERRQVLTIRGDATVNQNLLSAGLKEARTLITTLSQDAQNVFVTLTARQLNPKLQIIARADSEDTIQKLEFAGANRVLAPHIVGGLRMAQVVLRPTVTDFLELAMLGSNLDLQMEELKVSPSSKLVGLNLAQSEIRPKFELIIVAIKKGSGEMVFNPNPATIIHAFDTLIAVGKKDNLKQLELIL